MTTLTLRKTPRSWGGATSEAVTRGHPDKICDQISDALLDNALRLNARARAGIECAIKDHDVWVFGEVGGVSVEDLDIETTIRRVLADIGHGEGRWGLDPERLNIRTTLGRQADEIAAGIDQHSDLGAGDQGVMIGYATDETDSGLPPATHVAWRLVDALQGLRSREPRLGPDGKAQATIVYDESGDWRVSNVVLSCQHDTDLGLDELRERLLAEVVLPVIGERRAAGFEARINPAGAFTCGGPVADSGLTGRKVVIDAYGPSVAHGGGAWSGKDGTKVDRSAAYAARQLARTLALEHGAGECLVQLAYAIGEPRPVALAVQVVSEIAPASVLEDRQVLSDLFTPRAMIERLSLDRPQFERTASGGHFGRSGLAWEAPLEISRPQ